MFPTITLMTQTCVVSHREPGDPDPYGDHDLATITTSTYACWLAQSARTEEVEGTVTAIERERWRLYLPPEAVIDANDTVMVGVETYEVNGEPWRVIDPITAAASHIEATLQRRR